MLLGFFLSLLFYNIISLLTISFLYLFEMLKNGILFSFFWMSQIYFLFLYFIFLMLMNSLVFLLTFGTNMSLVFMLAFSSWFLSFLLSLFKFKKYFMSQSIFSLILWSFDNFVYVLRPVTLTLRILINVSLGHVLMEMMVMKLSFMFIILGSFEMFVYFVQTFVFLVLVSSYLEKN